VFLYVEAEEPTMMQPSFATARIPGTPDAGPIGSGYQPGTCNIGSAEIARRRRAGHVGLLATIVLLGVLLAIGAPPLVRLIVALPAAGSASGYLQAWFRFCVAFGSRGIFNFGQLGQSDQVVGSEARARDRTRSMQIGLASLAIGVAVAVAVVLLPI
jgi:hypothetical protein